MRLYTSPAYSSNANGMQHTLMDLLFACSLPTIPLENAIIHTIDEFTFERLTGHIIIVN